MHYNRVRVNGDPGPIGRILEPANQICSEDECEKKAKSKGLCNQHHYRKREEARAYADPSRRTPSWFTMDQKLRRIGWEEVSVRPELGPCWEWAGARDDKGYGRVPDKDRQMRFTHRIAHREWKGELDPDLGVLHHCDNPPCINPGHLYMGTQQNNVDDCVRRGRWGAAKGESSGHAKLTEKDVREIRASYVGRYGEMKALTEKYGVSSPTLYALLKRRTWKHVA